MEMAEIRSHMVLYPPPPSTSLPISVYEMMNHSDDDFVMLTHMDLASFLKARSICVFRLCF